MGKKSKNATKTKNVFKVAGAKSLKLKAKAKAVKTQLKNINVKTKDKVAELDKTLSELQGKVRTPAVPLKKPGASNKKGKNKLPSTSTQNEKKLEVKKKSERALKGLDAMQL